MGSEAGREKALAALGTMIDHLVSSGKHVTMVLAVPQGPQLDPKRMHARSFLGGQTVEVSPLTVKDFQALAKVAHIDELANVASVNGAEVVDPVPFLARDGVFVVMDDDGPIRYDDMHLRAQFVRDHVTYLDATVADDATTSGTAATSIKKPVEASSATTQPSEWRLVATKDYPAVLTFPDTMPGAMRVEFGTLPTLEPWRVRLASQPTEVQADMTYRISFRIRADKPREVIFTVRESQKPWTNLGLYGLIPVTEEWLSVTREFTAKADASNGLFSFDLGGSDVPVEIADVSFAPSPSQPPADAQAK